MQDSVSGWRKLKKHKLRLLGQLSIVVASGNVSDDQSVMVVKGVPQFPSFRPMTIARVPIQYNQLWVITNKSWHHHANLAMGWVELLPETFDNKLITSLLCKKTNLHLNV